MPTTVEIAELSLNGTKLPVMEYFYTLQGEGFYQGSAAYFIRLGGCEVGCHWCDVKDSWDFYKWPVVGVEFLKDEALRSGTKIAVITGGEPLHYNLLPLTTELQKASIRTHIETSGVYEVSGNWDWICFSPKKFKIPHESIFNIANELKVIIYHPSDLIWAEELADKINENCNLFLQPEWSKREKITPLLIEHIKNNPKWQLSLQVHKYLNIP